MSVRTKLCVVVAVALGVGVSTCWGQELTEAECLRRFEAEHPRVKAILAGVRITRAEAQAQRLLPNPAVSYNREDSANARDSFLLLQQTVPLNGRIGLLRRAGDAAVGAAEADSAYGIWLLRSEVRSVFYLLLLAQEREAAWQKAVTELEVIVRILREREREGEGSKFDRLRAERELADAQAEFANAQAQRGQLQAQLASSFAPGADPFSLKVKGEFTLAGELPPADELSRRALANRGDYRSEALHAERFDFERRAAQRQRLPDPTVTAGLKRTTLPGRSDNGYAVYVTVPLPLFNRGQADAARAQAAAERSQALQRSLEQQIRAEVQGAHAALQIRRRIAEQYGRELGEKGVELAGISRIAYEQGEQRILELLDAHKVAVQSHLRELDLKAEAMVAKIELERAVGAEVIP